MTDFMGVDLPFRQTVEARGRQLPAAFDAALALGSVDLARRDLTRAVLARMKAFYTAEDATKRFLGKRYGAAASDFFVETVNFYLKVVFHLRQAPLRVASEECVAPRRGALRPDISVWRDGSLVAVIECKTQLGWNRDLWREDFLARERKLKQEVPGAEAFLLVMTGSNWSGFGEDALVGRQFFSLLRDKWPMDIDLSDDRLPFVGQPIELLFEAILHRGLQ